MFSNLRTGALVLAIFEQGKQNAVAIEEIKAAISANGGGGEVFTAIWTGWNEIVSCSVAICLSLNNRFP
jgi:hypothetical protein